MRVSIVKPVILLCIFTKTFETLPPFASRYLVIMFFRGENVFPLPIDRILQRNT